MFVEGHVNQLNSVLPKNWKRIVNTKTFFGWFITFYAWLILGSLAVLQIRSTIFTSIWVLSIIVIVIIYPCIISLGVYIPVFQYLKKSKDETQKKKCIVKSLTFATISLATPWILLTLVILSFYPVPIWSGYFVALGIYIALFFIAVDLPYYQSMEDVKKRKVKGLTLLRESLVQKLCDLNDTSERVAVELNIERIDRDIEKINSESSHPYLFLKPIAGFVVVSILANLLVEIIKVTLHLG